MVQAADLARQLLKKAGEDLYVAERMKQDTAAPQWVIGFHAQQAAEKALKAVLVLNGVEYPRTHNLVMLAGLVIKNKLPAPPHIENLGWLVPFGVAFRYGELDVSDEPTEIPEDALTSIKTMLSWAESCFPGKTATND